MIADFVANSTTASSWMTTLKRYVVTQEKNTNHTQKMTPTRSALGSNSVKKRHTILPQQSRKNAGKKKRGTMTHFWFIMSAWRATSTTFNTIIYVHNAFPWVCRPKWGKKRKYIIFYGVLCCIMNKFQSSFSSFLCVLLFLLTETAFSLVFHSPTSSPLVVQHTTWSSSSLSLFLPDCTQDTVERRHITEH